MGAVAITASQKLNVVELMKSHFFSCGHQPSGHPTWPPVLRVSRHAIEIDEEEEAG